MKKQLLIGLCAAGIALVSIPTRTSAVEVKNVITRTFPVSASSVLKIDNTFGDVVIAPGNVQRSTSGSKLPVQDWISKRPGEWPTGPRSAFIRAGIP